jgi:hypothetical protein
MKLAATPVPPGTTTRSGENSILSLTNCTVNANQANGTTAEGVVFNPLDFSDIKDIAGNLRVSSQLDIIDIGAVEFAPSTFTTTVAVTPATINTSGDAQLLTVQATVSSSSGVTVIGGTVTFQVTDSKGTPIGGPTPSFVASPSSPNVYTGVLSICG